MLLVYAEPLIWNLIDCRYDVFVSDLATIWPIHLKPFSVKTDEIANTSAQRGIFALRSRLQRVEHGAGRE